MSWRRLWLWNAAGNAALLAAAYFWLGIPDRKVWQLAASGAMAAGIVFGALWLHAATFAAFRQVEARKIPARLPAYAVWVVAVVALLALLAWVTGYFPRWSNWVASALTLRLHRAVRPQTVLRLLSWAGWALQWIVVPAGLLPLGSVVAAEGFRGFRHWRARPRFWLEYLVLLAVGWYLPWRLAGWVPEFSSFAMQTISLLVRFGLAWTLAVTAWLLLARSAGRSTA